jgi:hypothetical protein
MSPEEIASTFPEAVAVARQFRDVFGPGVRLIYARNQRGEELGKGLALGEVARNAR